MKNPTRNSRRMQVMYPERRRERRYMTLKHAGVAGIVLSAAFFVLSAWSAFRPNSSASGNLFRPRAQSSDSATTRRESIVIHEGSTGNHPGTSAVLLDAGALDQLRPASPPPAVPKTAPTAAEEMNFEHRTSQLGKGQRITISGGSEGVQVHAEPASKP
jgi:hypothetical protein